MTDFCSPRDSDGVQHPDHPLYSFPDHRCPGFAQYSHLVLTGAHDDGDPQCEHLDHPLYDISVLCLVDVDFFSVNVSHFQCLVCC